MPSNDNRAKSKNPIVAEIENENPPAGDASVDAAKLIELKGKDASALSGEELAFVADHKEDLSEDEQKKFGMLEDEGAEPPVTPTPETPEVNFDTIREKKPDQLTAEDRAFLEEHKDELDDADKKLLGMEPTPTTPPTTPPAKPPTTPLSDHQLSEQRREAQIISAQNKKITETIDAAAQLPEPTETELRTEAAKDGVSWDDFSETEKMLFKKNLISERRFAAVSSITTGLKQIDEWAKKVDSWVGEEKDKQSLPNLVGHEDEFRRFAMMEAHRGRGLEVAELAKLFLFDLPVTPKRAGSLFPVGGGAPPEKPKSDVITDADEAKRLKANNPQEYRRKVASGKIKIEVE